MNNYNKIIGEYLDYCLNQKRLNAKTIHAYTTDLKQLTDNISSIEISDVTTEILEMYIRSLHIRFKPRTAKRKIASIKAFFRYLEYHNIISYNPWSHIQSKFREPETLPRVIPLDIVQKILITVYKQITDGKTAYRRRNAIRDAAICELLFATGIRILNYVILPRMM